MAGIGQFDNGQTYDEALEAAVSAYWRNRADRMRATRDTP